MCFAVCRIQSWARCSALLRARWARPWRSSRRSSLLASCRPCAQRPARLSPLPTSISRRSRPASYSCCNRASSMRLSSRSGSCHAHSCIHTQILVIFTTWMVFLWVHTSTNSYDSNHKPLNLIYKYFCIFRFLWKMNLTCLLWPICGYSNARFSSQMY